MSNITLLESKRLPDHSSKESVIALLKQVIDEIESGEVHVDSVIVITKFDSKDNFTTSSYRHGLDQITAIGLLEYTKNKILVKIT